MSGLGQAFEHRHAAHCESGVTASLFRHAGLDLSEPMIFGVGSGLYFFYAPFVKIVGMPLVSYRTRPGTIFRLACRRLGVKAVRRSFFSAERGIRELDLLLEQGRPVGLQANIFWLRYFPREFRSQFNGHNLIALSREGDVYEVSDPVLPETVKCEAEWLERARFAKGMLAPRGHLYYAESIDPTHSLEESIPVAVRDTSRRMLTSMPFAGVAGMRTLARHMRAWPVKHAATKHASLLLGHVIRMQEEVGTGGAGFRFMYAAFLEEAGERLGHEPYLEAARRMTEAGDAWRTFAIVCGRVIKDRLHEGEDFDVAADRLLDCAEAEEGIYRFLLAHAPQSRGRRVSVGAAGVAR